MAAGLARAARGGPFILHGADMYFDLEIGGWRLSIFNDAGQLDGVYSATSPEGRTSLGHGPAGLA